MDYAEERIEFGQPIEKAIVTAGLGQKAFDVPQEAGCARWF